jgi:uncharacterized protein YbjT (DUF2867 family)
VRVAITGGTGFVGGHLAKRLAADGHEVVVVARGVDERPWAKQVLATAGVTVRPAGIEDEEALTVAFDGCDAVAHCAGINREIGTQTYEAVHVRGTANVVRAAERAGVKRIALVSFLRARPASGSGYHNSKWAAEEIVRASTLEWTVLKPGMMFGVGDHMLDHLSASIHTFPVFAGVGARPIRPLAVDDLLKLLAAALIDGRLAGMTIAPVGPTEIGFDDAARLVARTVGKRRIFVRLPLVFHRLLALIAERTMKVPLISTAQVRMLAEGIVDAVTPVDDTPTDLAPSTPFDADSIRRGLPPPHSFRFADLRIGGAGGRREVRVCGVGTETIARSPREIIEFVLDVDRYRQADRKLGRVHWIRRTGDGGLVRHGGRLRGLPTPAITLAFRMLPDGTLEFRSTQAPWPLKRFEGGFRLERTHEGVRVTHEECLIFGRVVGRFFERIFGEWLRGDTAAEVKRMKTLLERTP